MNEIEAFDWLASQALDGLEYFSAVTLALFVAVISAAVFWAVHPEPANPSRHVKLALTLFVAPIIALGIGSLCRDQRLGECPIFVVHALVVGQLVLSVVLVIKLRGYRLITAALSAFVLWGMFWVWFVSMMSISGDWI